MKKFEIPQMTLIHLVNEDVICNSILCTSKACSSYCSTCDCSHSYDCPVVGGCSTYCSTGLCTAYYGDQEMKKMKRFEAPMIDIQRFDAGNLISTSEYNSGCIECYCIGVQCDPYDCEGLVCPTLNCPKNTNWDDE